MRCPVRGLDNLSRGQSMQLDGTPKGGFASTKVANAMQLGNG
jgi:hypothetical protein